MFTEHYENGDIRITFSTKEEYWDFLEVASFKSTPWVIRIYNQGEYHLSSEFPKTRNEYYGR